MSLFELAYSNCKNNIKSYLMLFISMVFSVIVLCNMQILCHGETMNALRAMNPYKIGRASCRERVLRLV